MNALITYALALTICLSLVGCELPDVRGLNSMSGKTQDMSDKMDKTVTKMDETNQKLEKTKETIHKQTLLVALTELAKPENQALVFPIPTGLMAAAKAFAEEATSQELVELTYLWIRELEEVDPIYALNADLAPSSTYSESQLQVVRLQKVSKLFALMAIAGFTPDLNDQEACRKVSKAENCVEDRILPMINDHIIHNSRYFETALNFLALRTFFIREVFLKQSLKVDADSADVLKTSGMMNDAVKYLLKLNQVSKLPFASAVQVHIKEKQYNLIAFDEEQNSDGLLATAQAWRVALSKAEAGKKAFQKIEYTNDDTQNDYIYEKEMILQDQAIQEMKANVLFWEEFLK